MTAAADALVLANATVVDGDDARHRDLAIAGDRIVPEATAAARRIDLAGHYVYPGLINAHDHLQLNGFTPLRHDGAFSDSYAWIAALEARMTDREFTTYRAVPAEWRFWHGVYKNLFSGVTTVAHHDPVPEGLDVAALPVTLADTAWAHSLALGTPDERGATRYGPRVVDSFHAARPGQPWVIHLAEGTSDVARAELRSLQALGLLEERTVLVHGVGLSEADVRAIIDARASVVWCPASNLELLGVTLHPRRLFQAGRLALGTDARLTGSRDLLDEMRVARAQGDLSAKDILRLVTRDAAAMLNVTSRGSLAHGSCADCLVLRENGDPWETLVRASRTDCRAVIRNGRIAVGDPDLYLAVEGASASASASARELTVDGQRKLIRAEAVHEDGMALEPGAELCVPEGVA